MKALVVYESMYGNTHHVAAAIAEGLAEAADVEVVPIEGATTERLEAAHLLVVGGPTHAHGMSRPSTRKGAADAARKDSALTLEPDAEGPGLRDWFDEVERISGSAAAFDTRMHGPAAMTGRASKGIAKRLTRAGATMLAEPESFLVTKDNHLDPGEEQRAREWAEALGRAITEEQATAGGS